MAINFFSQTARDYLAGAETLDEALRNVRCMCWEEVYIPPDAPYRAAAYPWDGWEYVEVYSQGISLPAPCPTKEAGYQAAAADNKDTVVGRILRKKVA